ncbi:MAG: hypothetical protein IPJ77_20880 [Planctomycetes bacterium]|mgnify:CR=1 FL=1|nr:hypothetical protein [Planctomycetota bacterium]
MCPKHETKERRPSDLERLLEELQNGNLDDASELNEAEIELLRREYGDAEALQDLVDRLRGAGTREP